MDDGSESAKDRCLLSFFCNALCNSCLACDCFRKQSLHKVTTQHYYYYIAKGNSCSIKGTSQKFLVVRETDMIQYMVGESSQLLQIGRTCVRRWNKEFNNFVVQNRQIRSFREGEIVQPKFLPQ